MSSPGAGEDRSLDFLRDQPIETEKPLGSLGQNVRLKELKTAKLIFVVIGLLTIGMNVLEWNQIPTAVDAAIKKEIDPLIRKGMVVDQAALDELRASAIRTGQLAAMAFIGIGVIYLLFAVFVEKFPVPITISGLVIFVASAAIMAVFEPMMLAQGIIVKILIVVGLFKAIQAAIAYEKQNKAAIDAQFGATT